MKKSTMIILSMLLVVATMLGSGNMQIYADTMEGNKVVDLSEYDLKNGESVEIGDYIITYSESLEKSESKARTLYYATYTHTSNYEVKSNSTQEKWYKITQKTKYYYNGSNYVYIDTTESGFSVTSYKSACSYSVTEHSIVNGSSEAKHVVGLKLKLGSSTLKVSDTVKVYPDGSTGFTHTSS